MNHIESEGDLIYYDEEFRVVLENHLHYLIKHPDTTISIVQDHEMIKNKCLFGFPCVVFEPKQAARIHQAVGNL